MTYNADTQARLEEAAALYERSAEILTNNPPAGMEMAREGLAAIHRQYAADIRAVVEKVSAYKLTLEEIAEPIRFIQQRAEAEGSKIDGSYARMLANDPNYIRTLARVAVQEAD